MDLYILDKTLSIIGIVDYQKSVIWANRYNATGDCEIVVPITMENLELFKHGNYIMRMDDSMVCRIESRNITTSEDEDDFLIVVGYDVKKILHQRVIWKQTTFNGTAENFIRKIVDENVIRPTDSKRAISNFRLGASNVFTEKVDIQSSYEYLDEKIQEICKTFGYGFKVELDDTGFVFNIYKGVDRSYAQNDNDFVVFSPEFDNIVSSEYEVDSTGFYSVALIAGEGEGNKRVKTSYDLTEQTGIDRFELFVDASGVSSQIDYEELLAIYPSGKLTGTTFYVDGKALATVDDATEPRNATLSKTPYTNLLIEAGKEQLSQTGTVVTFNGSVEPNHSYKYGIDYNLGDIVQVSNEYGISASARITEVIESYDENGYSIIPTFEYQDVEVIE